ncbi:MAG: hypothetical protein U1E28_22475 [Beijerinckiaceae bacterium]
MINPAFTSLILAPAIGVLFCVALYAVTARADRRALERADAAERRSLTG